MVLKALDGKHVSVVTAGVPCQGFSLCNRKRHDEDKRNFLFKEFLRIADAIKPDAVLLENVSGIRSAGNGSFTREIEKGIATLGYKTSVQVLNASDFGVPREADPSVFHGIATRSRDPMALQNQRPGESPIRSGLGGDRRSAPHQIGGIRHEIRFGTKDSLSEDDAIGSGCALEP